MVWPFKNKDKATADDLAAHIIARRAVDATFPNADPVESLKVADLVTANPSAAKEAQKVLALSPGDPHRELFSEGADQAKAANLIADWLRLNTASGHNKNKHLPADIVAFHAVEASVPGADPKAQSELSDLTVANRAAAKKARKVLDTPPGNNPMSYRQWWPKDADVTKAKELLNSEIHLTDATIHNLEKLPSTPAKAQASPGKGQVPAK